jgi:hypothetical protein
MPEDRATLFAPTGFFAARLYPERDTAALQTLLEACADFSDLVEGLPPGATAAREAFEESRPAKRRMTSSWSACSTRRGI